jgi:hypothetical protein
MRLAGRLRRTGEPYVDEPDGVEDSESGLAGLLERVASQQYRAEPVRPWMLIASRVALWGAVALGAFGGVVGCLGNGEGQAEAPTTAPPDPAIVPAQVSSVAELVVREWLTATETDDERLVGLFVEPPQLPRGLAPREVQQVRTVAGQLVQPRYWSVTVAAEMSVEVEVDATEETVTTDPVTGEEITTTEEELTWFVEVGIVGDPTRALAALRTPAIMPGPPAVDEGWSYTAEPWVVPQQGDDLAPTVEGFLAALLADEGDPGRYLAPGVEIPAADPPPLAEVFVEEVSADEQEDGLWRVQVRATGVTAAEEEQPLAYELVVRWRGDRYEVVELWGASTLTGLPPEPSGAAGGSPPASGGS